MDTTTFATPRGEPVTAVTAAEMREVDRVAVEEFGIGILWMMEHAGRNLAWHVRDSGDGPVVVLAGNGGNGGGGLCAARHLANRDVAVSVVLDRPPAELEGPARTHYETLDAMGLAIDVGPDALDGRGPAASGALGGSEPATVVDALVGYGLDGPLRGPAADLVTAIPPDATVLSLDVPSGLNATTGERAGPAADPDRVVTLALPKTGLTALDAELVLADIGLPAGVYDALDLPYRGPFDEEYWVRLRW